MDPLYVTLLPFAILKTALIGLMLWWALRHPPYEGGGEDDPGDDPPEPPVPRRPHGRRSRGVRPHGSPLRRPAVLRATGSRDGRRHVR